MTCMWCDAPNAREVVTRDEFRRTYVRWICRDCLKCLRRLEDVQ